MLIILKFVTVLHVSNVLYLATCFAHASNKAMHVGQECYLSSCVDLF